MFLFINMYGMKRKLSRTYFREMGSFFFSFSDFVTQYFVDFFSEHPKSLFLEKIQELLKFLQNIDLVYLLY